MISSLYFKTFSAVHLVHLAIEEWCEEDVLHLSSIITSFKCVYNILLLQLTQIGLLSKNDLSDPIE